MATEQDTPLSYEAGSDLSASQFCGVMLNSSRQLILPTAGGAIIGVLYTKPAAQGRAGTVKTFADGEVRIRLGGTVTTADFLKVDATGRFVTASATDIAAGSAVGLCTFGGTVDLEGSAILFGGAAPAGYAEYGFDDIVLSATAPSAFTRVTYVQTTGTQTKALGAGKFVGQQKTFVQSVAASTPIGTITGTFKTLAGGAATTLALGTAVASILTVMWDGAAWRAVTNIGGTGSSLA